MRNQLLKSFNEKQYCFVKQFIPTYFAKINASYKKQMKLVTDNYEFINARLGLAYISVPETSSGFAAIWCCNRYETLPDSPNFKIQGFTLNNKNEIIIYCLDFNENELFFKTNCRLY